MVGDSLTGGGMADLTAVRPHWEIQGRAGRNADCLPMFVHERLKHGYLGRLVIAVGANAVKPWKKADYQAVVDMVPPTTIVLFVNTYRDPALWPNDETNPFRTQAGVQYWYSKDMAAIAAARPSTCVANWRSYAANHPDMLRDGTHPTKPGHQQWANIVDTAATACVREKVGSPSGTG